MKKYFEILRRCRLFANIEDENLMAMLGCIGAKRAQYKKEELIFEEGRIISQLGVVLSGRVQIVRNDYYGNRSIVATITPGQIFGESFACAEGMQLNVDVIAAEDTEVMLADVRRLLHSCSNACDFHNQMIMNLLKIMAGKNLVFHQKIEITSKRTTRDKLMTYLLLEAKKQGSNSFTIPYDRQELADYLEVERSGLSAEISKMCREGIIESKRSWFRIL